jgi:threonine synthase
LAVVRDTGGAVIGVGEQEIEQVRNHLPRLGFYHEETSAVAMTTLPGLSQGPTPGPPVVPLTGHGLKTQQIRAS